MAVRPPSDGQLIVETKPRTMTLTEAQTRQRFIDSQLAEAGWGSDDRSVLEEFALGIKEDGSRAHGENRGFVDYVLVT